MVNLTIDVKLNFLESMQKLTEKSLQREQIIGNIKLKNTNKTWR